MSRGSAGAAETLARRTKARNTGAKALLSAQALRPGASLYIHAFGPQAPCSDPVNAGGGGGAAAASTYL